MADPAETESTAARLIRRAAIMAEKAEMAETAETAATAGPESPEMSLSMSAQPISKAVNAAMAVWAATAASADPAAVREDLTAMKDIPAVMGMMVKMA